VDSTAVSENVDLPSLYWWRPCKINILVDPERSSDALTAFLEKLRAACAEHGHLVDEDVEPGGEVDVVLAHVPVPAGPGTILDRLREQHPPLLLKLRQSQDVHGQVRHLVAVVEIEQPLSALDHAEVIHTARMVMGRIGAFKALFLTADPRTGDIVEATLCTLEGGHPSERTDIVRRVRDRLVSAACANEVAGRLDVVPDAVGTAEWEASRSPEILTSIGNRMGSLGLLPAPHRVSDYVSSAMAAVYQRYLGVKGFSEGMMFVFDPDLEALVVTASGSWDVDKRSLTREDVVVVDHRLHGGRIKVFQINGTQPKGPSVEAWEVCAILEASPTVRISKDPAGRWRWDPQGTVEVPAVRGGIHTHIGVDHADASVVETVAPDRGSFPYGFGCGTDLMVDIARATVQRSAAIQDPADPRCYVRWPMLYHGEMSVELWRPSLPDEPLSGLLDLFDPSASGAIRFRTDHIDQPV
jgi:hypothetical protein